MATITFPDDLVWAFNPNYIKIEGAGTVKKATIAVSTNTIEVALYGGKGEAYISRLLQMLFEDPTSTRLLSVDLSVTINGETQSKTINAIWGSIEITDEFPSFGNVERNVQYFVNFPFTLNLLLSPDTTLKMKADSGEYNEGESIETAELREIDVADYDFDNVLVFSQETTGYYITSNGYYYKTSDSNYYNVKSTLLTKVQTRHEKEGYYLRWIDRFGFVQYYLFSKGEKKNKTKISSETLNRDAMNAQNILVSTNVRPLSVETTQTVSVCALNLDKQTFAYVNSIISSPIVDLYVGKRSDGTQIWMPVNIASSTYKESLKHLTVLQDLEVTLTLPSRITQSL